MHKAATQSSETFRTKARWSRKTSQAVSLLQRWSKGPSIAGSTWLPQAVDALRMRCARLAACRPLTPNGSHRLQQLVSGVRLQAEARCNHPTESRLPIPRLASDCVVGPLSPDPLRQGVGSDQSRSPEVADTRPSRTRRKQTKQGSANTQ